MTIYEECNTDIKDLQEDIPVEEETQDLSEFFKVFSDPTRIKILSILNNRELCVHVISEVIDMQQTAVSHQLKILRQSRLVKYRKKGKHVFYSLNDDHISEIIKIGLEHIKE